MRIVFSCVECIDYTMMCGVCVFFKIIFSVRYLLIGQKKCHHTNKLILSRGQNLNTFY